jgi:hypothetical protein
MYTNLRLAAAALALPLAIASAQQQVATTEKGSDSGSATATGTDTIKTATVASTLVPQIVMQNIRPSDQRGVNMFEAPKDNGVPFTGFRMSWGAAFRQQFQGLEHRNSATPVLNSSGVNQNALMDIGRGFNLASANLNLNMQLADGIRVQLTSYLSSKHHQETWVKDGYALIDKSPIDHPLLNGIMKYTTLKLGHFEINYGDQHFRRTDNGNGIYNPFVGNLIIDAFTTEVGGEAYFRNKGVLAMVGLTSGTIQGGVTTPAARSNAYLGKLGYDTQLTDDIRVRLTGSYYKNDKSPSNTLLTGDRAGSPYNLVMENTAATTTAAAWSGNIRPGFANSVRAYSVNPFLKFRGAEFFGTYDNFRGKSLAEPTWRDWNQYAGDAVYRFWSEKLFVGARANTAKGRLLGIATDVSVDRYATGAGWFVTPVMLLKGEFMQQKYHGFPATDIRRGGKIQGFVFEGVVSF